MIHTGNLSAGIRLATVSRPALGDVCRDEPVIAEHAAMERDDDLQPWLRGLDEAALAQICVDVTYAICRPSFGSLSKRELEQVTFALFYEHLTARARPR